MRAASIVFWGFVGATGVVYGMMVGRTLPEIRAAAGGLVAFDMRPGGYSASEARAFLDALSAAGRATYLGIQHQLDTLFPGLLAVALVWAIWRLSHGLPRLLRAVLLPLPLAASAFDYLENLRVRGLLLAGPEGPSDAMIAAASTASITKATLSTIAYVALLLLGSWRLKKRVWR